MCVVEYLVLEMCVCMCVCVLKESTTGELSIITVYLAVCVSCCPASNHTHTQMCRLFVLRELITLLAQFASR